jgi:hypothetical protein
MLDLVVEKIALPIHNTGWEHHTIAFGDVSEVHEFCVRSFTISELCKPSAKILKDRVDNSWKTTSSFRHCCQFAKKLLAFCVSGREKGAFYVQCVRVVRK